MNEPQSATDSINKAIAFYRSNKADIKAALPIRAKGRTFGERWPQTLEASIERWECGQMKVDLAEIYICFPMRAVLSALKGNKNIAEMTHAKAEREQQILRG